MGVPHPETDEIDNESRCSQQSRSPSDDNSTNSTHLLRLSLSAIHAKMEESIKSSITSKLQKRGLKQLTELAPEKVKVVKVPCSRRYMACRRTYKLVLLISSVVTFLTYCYYYHSYFHVMNTSKTNPSKVSPPRLIVNQYDHYDHYDHFDDPDFDHFDQFDHFDDDQYRYDQYDEYHIEYQYEYQFQQNYFHQRYGYYHDSEYSGSAMREEYDEYNDTMLYCWQLLIMFIVGIICFTSAQVFRFDEVPTKHE